MGDALVDELRDGFDLKENADGVRACPKCGGTNFTVKLEGPVYQVSLSPEDSHPDAMFGQAGPEITRAACTRCGHEILQQE